jgi:glycosyltransferase involved in cell wall biosynthesis
MRRVTRRTSGVDASCRQMVTIGRRERAISETDTPEPTEVRVLVFNFFAGLKPRGIPVYARELEVCFQRIGVSHRELRGPRWLSAFPSMLQNICFVFFEQVLAPLLSAWWRCSLTVYPYNSGGVLDALAGKSVMVIHDLIPNRRSSRSLAARYIQVCQAWHAWLGRPIATVSRHTMKQLERIGRFRRCEKYLWSNPFYAFEAALARPQPPRCRTTAATATTVLLCSGIGPNKDYRGALRLLRGLSPGDRMVVRVLGFGDDARLAERAIKSLPEAWRDRVTVLPRLSLDEAVGEFLGSDLVWVHSRAEGFGRPVMEARMCGKPVLASDIGAFRQMRRFQYVHLYRDGDFETALQAALVDARSGGGGVASARDFNRKLEEEVLRLLGRQRPPAL